MTPRELLEAFETLADAPDAVRWLRDLVLQLAVRGQLVPQDPKDEPAKLLLRRLGPSGADASRSADFEGFDLPVGWAWATVADVGQDGADSVSDGPFGSKLKGEHYVNSPGYRVVRLGNVGRGAFKDGDKIYISGAYFAELYKYHLKEGDIIVASLGDPPGRACIVPAFALPAINKADCFRVRPHSDISARYISIVLNSPFGSERSLALHRGDTRGRINLSHLRTAPLPVPPIAEQHRIVARVDELMGLLDGLETARTTCENVRRAARDAALAALRDAEDAEAAEDAWARIASQMDALFSAPDDIAHLRQIILNLAVRGHLVPQDARDEPAAVALEAARQRRSALLSDWPESFDEGRALLRKLDRATSVSHIPYQTPSGWVCTTLIDATLAVVDCHNKTAPYTAEGVPILRTTNIRDGAVLPQDMRFISEPTYQIWSRRCPPRSGDVVFTREAPMGQAAIIPDGLKVCLGQRTMLIRPMEGISLNRYILLALLEPGVRERAKHTAVGMTVQHLRVGDVESLPIMLPPLAEQYRIVAKVDALMALCDDLEARLAVAHELQAKFAAAAVHHLDI